LCVWARSLRRVRLRRTSVRMTEGGGLGEKGDRDFWLTMEDLERKIAGKGPVRAGSIGNRLNEAG
jgi:hypothetical protein